LELSLWRWGIFSNENRLLIFPIFSRFFWCFFSPFWFLLLLRVVCALKAQFLFPCLFVLSPSLLDDDGVRNCLNKSAVTLIFVVFVFFSGFVSMPLLVVILWS
jgi:hypothetical protein